jgi:hypothetical protein
LIGDYRIFYFLIRCDNRYFGEQCETNSDDIIKKQYSKMIELSEMKMNLFFSDAILLLKSRFLAGCILILAGVILILIAFISCFLARNNKTQREKISITKSVINNTNTKSIQPSVSSLPNVRTVNNRSILTNELSTATDDDKNLNGYCISREIDGEQFPLKTNKIEQINSESKSNHLILSEGYLEFYQPDAESGLIRPLNIQADIPKRHTKYVSSPHRFLLPRPVNQ